MPGPTAGNDGSARPARTLAQVYRRFGEVAAATSPLYERVAVALSESDRALRAIEAAPARRRHPSLILAALHDLALAGHAPALAAAYAAADGDAAADSAIATLLAMTDSVVAIAVRRRTLTDQTGHGAVLYPAITEAARRAGAGALGLIDVGRPAGLNLAVDRVGISYSNGQSLGDASSPVQLSASIVGARPIPTWAMPEVVARVCVDPDPVDVTDAVEARWLRACLPPDQPELAATLDAELALATAAPPLLLRGDPVGVLPDALARVPAGALPVVTTTWALSQLLARTDAWGSSTASRKRRPGGRLPGSQRRASASRRRCRHSAIVPHPATASSVWRSSGGRASPPRRSAVAGRRAACCRGSPPDPNAWFGISVCLSRRHPSGHCYHRDPSQVRL